MADLTELATRHSTLTNELAAALRELGDTRSAIVTNQANAWHASVHLGITERREEVKHACAHLISETETQLGEVEALRAELADIELHVKVLTNG
jgi:hypothetical protein